VVVYSVIITYLTTTASSYHVLIFSLPPCVPGGRCKRRRTEPADPEAVGFVRRRQTVLRPGVQLWNHRHAGESRTSAAAVIVAVRRRYDATPPLVDIVVSLLVVCNRLRSIGQVSSSRRHRRCRRDRSTTIVVQEISIARVRWWIRGTQCRGVL